MEAGEMEAGEMEAGEMEAEDEAEDTAEMAMLAAQTAMDAAQRARTDAEAARQDAEAARAEAERVVQQSQGMATEAVAMAQEQTAECRAQAQAAVAKATQSAAAASAKGEAAMRGVALLRQQLAEANERRIEAEQDAAKAAEAAEDAALAAKAAEQEVATVKTEVDAMRRQAEVAKAESAAAKAESAAAKAEAAVAKGEADATKAELSKAKAALEVARREAAEAFDALEGARKKAEEAVAAAAGAVAASARESALAREQMEEATSTLAPAQRERDAANAALTMAEKVACMRGSQVEALEQRCQQGECEARRLRAEVSELRESAKAADEVAVAQGALEKARADAERACDRAVAAEQAATEATQAMSEVIAACDAARSREAAAAAASLEHEECALQARRAAEHAEAMLGQSQRRQAQMEARVRAEVEKNEGLVEQLEASQTRSTAFEKRSVELQACLTSMATGLQAHRAHMTKLKSLHAHQTQQLHEYAERVAILERENAGLGDRGDGQLPGCRATDVRLIAQPARAYECGGGHAACDGAGGVLRGACPDTSVTSSLCSEPANGSENDQMPSAPHPTAIQPSQPLQPSPSPRLEACACAATSTTPLAPQQTLPRADEARGSKLIPPSVEVATSAIAATDPRLCAPSGASAALPSGAKPVLALPKVQAEKASTARQPLAYCSLSGTNRGAGRPSVKDAAALEVGKATVTASARSSTGLASPSRHTYTNSASVVHVAGAANGRGARTGCDALSGRAAESAATTMAATDDEKIQKLISTCSYWANVLHAAEKDVEGY